MTDRLPALTKHKPRIIPKALRRTHRMSSTSIMSCQLQRPHQPWLKAVHRAPRAALAYAGVRNTRNSNVMAAVAGNKEVWALDFDGVVCDSCGESSLSAWKAAVKLWPEVFGSAAAQDRKAELVEKMRDVRPVVETGYENIVQIRCLLEGVTVEDMLERWHELLPQYMQHWQLDRAEIVELFDSTRDQWIATDLQGWLAPNRIYPGVAEAVKRLIQDHEVYIVTTKQARFTDMILRQMAGIEFPEDRIFSQTVSGRPKSEVLEALQAAHPDAGSYHFVEDKLSTLHKVAKHNALAQWQLYLVDWGYNTSSERGQAASNDRIRVIGCQEFERMAHGA